MFVCCGSVSSRTNHAFSILHLPRLSTPPTMRSIKLLLTVTLLVAFLSAITADAAVSNSGCQCTGDCGPGGGESRPWCYVPSSCSAGTSGWSGRGFPLTLRSLAAAQTDLFVFSLRTQVGTTAIRTPVAQVRVVQAPRTLSRPLATKEAFLASASSTGRPQSAASRLPSPVAAFAATKSKTAAVTSPRVPALQNAGAGASCTTLGGPPSNQSVPTTLRPPQQPQQPPPQPPRPPQGNQRFSSPSPSRARRPTGPRVPPRNAGSSPRLRWLLLRW